MMKKISQLWHGLHRPTVHLTADTDSGIGTYSAALIFNGAAQPMNICYLSGADLQPDKNYKFKGGLLVVQGDIPANVRLRAENAKLVVQGNIHDKANIDVAVPERDFNDTIYSTISGQGVGMCVSFPVKVFGGFEYPEDTDPALVVTGRAAGSCHLKSNHGVHISKAFNDEVAKKKVITHTRRYHAPERSVTTHGTVPDLYIKNLL